LRVAFSGAYFPGGRELFRRALVSKDNRVSEHSAAGGVVLQLLLC
jgi:hypothetical protein